MIRVASSADLPNILFLVSLGTAACSVRLVTTLVASHDVWKAKPGGSFGFVF